MWSPKITHGAIKCIQFSKNLSSIHSIRLTSKLLGREQGVEGPSLPTYSSLSNCCDSSHCVFLHPICIQTFNLLFRTYPLFLLPFLAYLLNSALQIYCPDIFLSYAVIFLKISWYTRIPYRNTGTMYAVFLKPHSRWNYSSHLWSMKNIYRKSNI